MTEKTAQGYRVACPRCAGTGRVERHANVKGGVCFACNGSGYRVQLGVLDEKTGAWENDEQDEAFPTLADVREYATQEGYEPMDVDFEQMTDEEFQQFLDRSRI